MTILQNGNVGIGTINPGTLLGIYSNSPNNHFRVAGNGPSMQWVNGSITTGILNCGIIGLATGSNYYVQGSVAKRFCPGKHGHGKQPDFRHKPFQR
ncbi:hypothetical protein ACX0G9_06885 [Flavitalea flava]